MYSLRQSLLMCTQPVTTPFFFHSHHFFTSVSDHVDNTVIIGGDFNLVLNSGKDRLSTTGSLRNSQSTNIVKQYMNNFGDGWRSHPYTFLSPAHHSYSGLYYFIFSSSLKSNIQETEIHPITISDHAPVFITLVSKRSTSPFRNWRFDTSLIKDPEFIHLKRYSENNILPGISPSVL